MNITETESGRILVVEDEALVQMLLVDNLEEIGFKVDTAMSAADAVDKLRQLSGQVDGAFVDVGLPDRRGDVLVRELRAIDPELPIVITTGYSRADLQSRFKDEGNIEVLSKPFTVESIMAALKSVGLQG